MLEKIVEKLLNRFLAPYVDGISKDGLSILQGKLEFHDLTLKSSAFDGLRLPSGSVRRGRIGHLLIQIPWKSLSSAQISLELQDISVDICRIADEVPGEKQILMEFREVKQRNIERKLGDLQRLAEASEQLGSQSEKGYMARWLHRMAQNLYIKVQGGVMARCAGPATGITGGFLLEGLEVRSAEVNTSKPDHRSLHKVCVIQELALFIAVCGGPTRYLFEPTTMALHINHEETKLQVSLDVGADSGVLLRRHGIVISRAALYHTALAIRSLGAWQKHVSEVVLAHSQGGKVYAGAPESETKIDYMRFYRELLLQEKLSTPSSPSLVASQLQQRSNLESWNLDNQPLQTLEDRLQAIEDMVPSRLVARWRYEVLGQIEVAKGMSQTDKRGAGGFFGLLWRRPDAKGSGLLLEQEEWETIQQQVEEAQAGLADLIKPTTVEMEFKVAVFRALVFDDGAQLEPNVDIQRQMELAQEGGKVTFRSLQKILQASATSTVETINEITFSLHYFQAHATTKTKVVQDVEKTEWLFGIQVGTMNVCCNSEKALNYSGGELTSVGPRGPIPKYKDYITLSNTVLDDGSDLLRIDVNLPPLELAASPEMLSSVMRLVDLQLPPPPVYKVRKSVRPFPQEAVGPQEVPRGMVRDWQSDLQAWRENQNTRIREMAHAQVARVRESALKLHFAVSIDAPKLAVRSDARHEVHVDLGKLSIHSSEIVTLDRFDITLELQDTEVVCRIGAKNAQKVHQVLDPINFRVNFSGGQQAAPVDGSSSGGGRVPAPFLDLNVMARLEPLRMTVSPQVVRLAQSLPRGFQAALGHSSHFGGSRPRSVRASSTCSYHSTSTTSRGGDHFMDAQEFATAPTVASPVPKTDIRVDVKAEIEMVSLTVRGEMGEEVLRAIVREVESSASRKLDGIAEVAACVKEFVVKVRGERNLIQMKETADMKHWALSITVLKPVQPPLVVGATICPIKVAWHKSSIEPIMWTWECCHTLSASGRKSAVLNRDLTLVGDVVSIVKAHAEDNVSTPAPVHESDEEEIREDQVEGYELVKTGVSSSDQLPNVHTADSPMQLKLDVKFGGLLVELCREDTGHPYYQSCWKATSQSPLIQLNSRGTTFRLQMHANGEAVGEGQLSSLRLIYDGKVCLEPCENNTNVFEYSFRKYRGRAQGGPMHSMCIRARFRQIRYVFFLKHVDCFVDYLQNHILAVILNQALIPPQRRTVHRSGVPQAAEEESGMAKPQLASSSRFRSFVLWHVCFEGPILYWPRDEEVLAGSEGMSATKAVRKSSRETKRNSNSQRKSVLRSTQRTAAAAQVTFESDCSDEFEDAIEYNNEAPEEDVPPTPMVSSLREFFEVFPGNFVVWNSFDLEGPGLQASPPQRFTARIGHCYGRFVDKDAGTSAVVVEEFEWESVVRVDLGTSAEPLHVAVGLNYYCPITVNVSPQVWLLFLNVINENCAYSRYFYSDAKQAPEGAVRASTPTFEVQAKHRTSARLSSASRSTVAERRSLSTTTSQSDDDLETPAQFESIRLNCRAELKHVKVNGSYMLNDTTPGQGSSKLLTLALTNTRLTHDMVLYYAGAAPVFQVSGSSSNISIEDARPAKFRHSINSHVLQCPKDESSSTMMGNRDNDGWMLIVDRQQGRMPYSWQDAALQVVYTKTSSNANVLKVGLAQPRLYMLLQFIKDCISFIDVPLQASTLIAVAPPALLEDDVAEAPPHWVYDVEVDTAEVCFYTQCDKPAAPMIETLGSVTAAWHANGADMFFDEVCARGWSIRRSEGGEAFSATSRRSRTVHVCQLSQCNLAGKMLREDLLPELSVAIQCCPVVICLTILDVPHLCAAIVSLGSDARGGSMASRFPLRGSCAQDAEGGGAERRHHKITRRQTHIKLRQASTCVGSLRFTIVSLNAVEADGKQAKNVDKLRLTICLGSERPVPIVVGHDYLLPVPGSVSRLGPAKGLQKGGMVNLNVHRGTGEFEETVASLRFPIELCAGPGLDVRRRFKNEGVATCINEPLPRIEVHFKACYLPEDPQAAMTTRIASISPTDQTIDEFLRPVQQLSAFLGHEAPPFPSAALRPKLHHARTRATRRSAFRMDAAEYGSMSIKVSASVEGLEASFLDECHANFMPVLRVSMNSKRSGNDDLAGMLQELRHGNYATGAGGILFLRNVHNQLQKGTALTVEDCILSVEYLNARAGLWEPLLERWSFDLFFNQGQLDGISVPRPQHLSSLSAVERWSTRVDVTLASFAPLLINITPQFCSLAAMFIKQKEMYLAILRGDGGAAHHENVAAGARYRLLNLTGSPLRLAFFWRDDHGNGTAESDARDTEPSEPDEVRGWQLFEPSAGEVGLDPFLRCRTAEQLRRSADAELMCSVAFVGGEVSTMVVLSSTCDSTLPLPSSRLGTLESKMSFSPPAYFAPSEETRSFADSQSRDGHDEASIHGQGSLPALKPYVACEVLTPHPSYKVLMVASPVRIFNHVQWALEVRFGTAVRKAAQDPLKADASSGDSEELGEMWASKSSLAAPMDLLPERIACPLDMEDILRPGGVASVRHSADIRKSETFGTGQRVPASMIRHSSMWMRMETTPELDLIDTSEAQHVLPQEFCPAPMDVTGTCTALQLRLAGAGEWCQPLVFPDADGGSESLDESEVLLFSHTEVPLHLRVRFQHHALTSAAPYGYVLAAHVFSPLQVLNATPVRLHFRFEAEMPNGRGHEQILEVLPFTSCDLPAKMNMSSARSACSLRLALAEDDIELEMQAELRSSQLSKEGNDASPWRLSRMIPQIFNASIGATTVGHLPLCREDASQEPDAEPELNNRQAVPDPGTPLLSLMVDRGLAVRVSCRCWLIDRTGLSVRVNQGGQMLPRVGGHITLLNSNFEKAEAATLFIPSPPGMVSHAWEAQGEVRLPDRAGQHRYATLLPSSTGLPVHVCLQAEHVSPSMTLGGSSQIISVLPQVMIYNELPNDTLLVRAFEESSSMVQVLPMSCSSFLRWHPGDYKAGVRSPVSIQFRIATAASLGWSQACDVDGEVGWKSLILPTEKANMDLASRMFTSEVAERDGVLCFTVRGGSHLELQNFSQLVRRASLSTATSADAGLVFVAQNCETVEVAFTSEARNLHLELEWTAEAGGGTSSCLIQDLLTPLQLKRRTPGGWHEVAIEVGCTGDQCWLRIADAGYENALALGSQQQQPRAQLRVGITLAHIGVSILSLDHEREAFYCELRQVGVLAGVWDDARSIDIVVADVQADCQLLDFKDVPVILASRGENDIPWLRMQAIQTLPLSVGVVLQSLQIQMDAMEVSINQDLLDALTQTLKGLLTPFEFTQGVTQKQLDAWRVHPFDGSLAKPPLVPLPFLIKHFVMHGLEVHLWLSVRLQKFLPRPLSAFMRKIGVTQIGVQGLKIKLESEMFEGVAGPLTPVVKLLLSRYWLSLLRVVGSALGRNSLVELPSVPVTWVRRGVGTTLQGMCFLLTRATDVLEQITLDSSYIHRRRQRQQQRLQQVNGFRSGVNTAARHLGQGIYHIGDVIRVPIKHVRTRGLQGLVPGVGRGLLGTVVKPWIEAGYGVRALAQAASVKVAGHGDSKRLVQTRRRTPRVIYGGGHIREFDEAAALLTLEMATASMAAGSSRQACVAIHLARRGIVEFVIVSTKSASPHVKHLLLLVTLTQLMLVDLSSAGATATIWVRWSIPRTSYRGMRASSHGIIVYHVGAGEGEMLALSGAIGAATPSGQSSGTLGEAESSKWLSCQIPCEEADVMLEISRVLRPLQPLVVRKREGNSQ